MNFAEDKPVIFNSVLAKLPSSAQLSSSGKKNGGGPKKRGKTPKNQNEGLAKSMNGLTSAFAIGKKADLKLKEIALAGKEVTRLEGSRKREHDHIGKLDAELKGLAKKMLVQRQAMNENPVPAVDDPVLQLLQDTVETPFDRRMERFKEQKKAIEGKKLFLKNDLEPKLKQARAHHEKLQNEHQEQEKAKKDRRQAQQRQNPQASSQVATSQATDTGHAAVAVGATDATTTTTNNDDTAADSQGQEFVAV
jgi:hypothetical protein